MGMGKEMTISNQDDAGRGEEEKIAAQDTRGRLQKLLKDNNEEEAEKIEEGDGKKEQVSTMRKQIPTANVEKRRSKLKGTEKSDSVTKKIGNVTESSIDDSTKTKGFRPVGSRRKGKPRRAAGVFEW